VASWDRRSAGALAKLRDRAVRDQVRDVVAPFSPFWRERFAATGIKPSGINRVRDLAKIPAVGERDVCPSGDAAEAARLVVQASETGYALHAAGPALRKALLRRTFDLDAYRRQVEADSRATSYVFDGLAFRFPIASTRSDLDLIARAGARLWQVLGLTSADVLVSAVSTHSSTEHLALQYAAIAAGSPAMFPGDDTDAVAAALQLVPATVLAAPAGAAASLVDALTQLRAPMSSLNTLLLVGAPTAAQRQLARQALLGVGLPNVLVLAVHAPSGARVLWGECRPSAAGTLAGFHTYPDLDVAQLLDPETGEPTTDVAGGELVLTQLGFRGSALLRWRTGDLVQGELAVSSCPACGRTVPRVPSTIQPGALVPTYRPRDGRRARVDLRGLAGALVGRADVADWRAVLRQSARHGRDELLAYIAPRPGADPAEVTVATARDLRMVAGVLPSQIVAVGSGELTAIDARSNGLNRLTRRIAIRP
jgi:phenylacetate-coenzyme A ligase PaaK-like adenylate-forming protein